MIIAKIIVAIIALTFVGTLLSAAFSDDANDLAFAINGWFVKALACELAGVVVFGLIATMVHL